MIYLSASSIRDFLACSKRFYFRTNEPEEATKSPEAIAGTIVHKIIELHWDKQSPEDPAVQEEIEKQLSVFDNFSIDVSRIENCLYTFYSAIPEVKGRLHQSDLREFYFKEKISPNITMSGKMDWVIPDEGYIIDWKTGNTKTNISNDIQFIIYYTMFQKIFGKPAREIVQVNLSTQKISWFYPSKKYIDTLFNDIIPMIAKEVQHKRFNREGYYNGACYRCDFISICNKDFE